MQNGNTRLLCWPAPDGGSESPGSKLTVPAVSLSLLTTSVGKSIVFGTLQDRSLYVARRNQAEDGKFTTQYIAPLDICDDAVKHVGTVARVIRATEESEKVGSKRNAADSDQDRAMIYQIFVGKHDITLVRHEISASVDGADVVKKSGPPRSATISLIPATQRESATIDRANILEFFDDNGTVTILYSLKEHAGGAKNGHSAGEKQCYATVSLENGELTGTPLEVAPSTRQAGLVGPTIMAVLTSNDELVLYDAVRGAQIHRQALQDVGIDTAGGISIATDPKRGRLAIIFSRGEKMCVALSSVSEQLSLAAGLASSMEIATGEAVGFRVQRMNDLSTISDTSATAFRKNVHEEAIPQAVKMLEKAFRLICDGAVGAKKPSFLLDAYESAVALIILSTKRPSGNDTKDASADNPQDAIHSRKGEKSNGIHDHKVNGEVKNGSAVVTAKENLVNGQHVLSNPTARALTPHSIPSAFVEQATSIVIQILVMPGGRGKSATQDDAPLLLRRLIRTRKVSARSLFRSDPALFNGVLRSLEPSDDEKSAYTPVDLIYDTFRYCCDISERQMVTMLHYMLAKAHPSDIADWVLRNDECMDVAQSTTRLANRYVGSMVLSKGSVQETEQHQRLSARLILAGTEVLLLNVVAFSDCNETLLRGALADGIPPRELGILNQILIESIIPADVDANMTRRAMHWASTLCDRLRGPLSEAEGSVVTRIRKSVATEIAKTESLMSLQVTLQRALAAKAAGRSKKADAPSLDKNVSGHLPPYQVERLAF